MIKLTHYCYTLSSWSLAAEPAVEAVRACFGDRLKYEWRIAVMDYNGGKGAFARGTLEGPYARLRAVTGLPVTLDWWYEGYDWLVPDCVVEAARSLGATTNAVRLALANAGLRGGAQITRPAIALRIAAETSGIDVDALEAVFEAPETITRLHQMSQEFRALSVPLLPAFKLENGIGDTAVLSGLWCAEPLLACAESLHDDEESYRRLGYPVEAA